MSKRALIISITLFAPLLTYAQDKVSQEIQSELKVAQQRLIEQRKSISTQQRELSTQITEKQNTLLAKRRQARIARQVISDTDAYLRSLRNKEYASTNAAQSQSDILRSYGIQMSTKLIPGEAPDPRLDSIFSKNPHDNALLEQRLSILNLGLERLNTAIGGYMTKGQATTENANIVNGTILCFGPAKWFVAEDQSTAGNYHISKSGKMATLNPSGKKTALSLLAGKEALASIDITGGKAYALASIKSNPIELIKKGGAWVYPILLLAAIALFCAVKKALELRNFKEPKPQWLQQISQLYIEQNAEQAAHVAAGVNHPVHNVLPAIIQSTEHTLDLAEDVLYEKMIQVKESLRRWLPFISVTAAIAPLLGLLGTVSGLIRTFSVIAVEGTGEAQSISGGISEALITTLFGLAVAIPCFMAHSLLSRKAKGLEQSTERLSLEFLNTLRKNQSINS
ncbi:MAG: MotA/TolQ/ExbB proton channel family protein [Akkermansiaceae bacterium]